MPVPGSTPCSPAEGDGARLGSGGVGKTTIAAALGAGRRATQRRPGARAHGRPGATAGDARSVSERSATRRSRVPDAPSRPPASTPRGELWVAMLDTKAGWDELIRRHAPDAKVARRGARQPAVPEHHEPLRAQPRLHRDGAAARAARVRASTTSSIVDTPPSRNALSIARRAGADEGVLRQPAAALADRAVPVAAVHGGLEAVLPGRRSGARARGSCRTSPSSSSSSRRWRRASSRAPPRSSRCSVDPRTTFVVVSTLEAAPAHEAGYLAESCGAGDMHLGAIVANRVLPPAPCVAGSGASAQAPRRVGATVRWPDEVAARVPATRRRPWRRARRGRRALRRLAVVASREAERRAELASLAPMLLSVPSLAGHPRPRRPRSLGRSPPRPRRRRLTPIRVCARFERRPTFLTQTWTARADGRLASWPNPCGHDDSRWCRIIVWPHSPRSSASTRRSRRADVEHLQQLVDRVGPPGRPLLRRSAPLRPTTDDNWVDRRPGPPGDRADDLHDRLRGLWADRHERPLLAKARRSGVIVEGEIDVEGLVDAGAAARRPGPLRRRRSPCCAGVVAAAGRQLGELERTYLSIFERFAVMIAEGSFPFPGARSTTRARRRVSATA